LTRAGRGRSACHGIALALLALAAAALGGCGGSQDALAPKSHQAQDIATLFWWMAGGSFVGLGAVVALLVIAYRRRHVRGLGGDDGDPLRPGERRAWYVVVGGGIVLPIVVVSTVFVVSDVFVIRTTQAPAASATRLTVEVVGHQWWWEVRYPGTAAVTANEVHIPVDTPVRVEVRTADVIHSFWVPRLNRKIDAIPGQRNVVELDADAVGRYRGACAEFCGLQHAHMALEVVADPPDVFRRWLAVQAAPAAAPAAGRAEQGAQLFAASCGSCHAIRGTPAGGDVGPDLTHLASRASLAALTLANTRSGLRAWIAAPQHAKPGNQMPDLGLGGARLDALVAYLEGLR
jgi:cytochrome c oxidase subunit II